MKNVLGQSQEFLASSTSNPGPKASPPKDHSLQAVVIEPSPTHLKTLLEELPAMGFTTRGFRDPKDFEWQMKSIGPDLVILSCEKDCEIPSDFIIELRSSLPHCTILLTCESPPHKPLHRLMELGADDFLRKPILVDELMVRLEWHRSKKLSSPREEDANLSLRPLNREIERNGRSARLTATEFNIFRELHQSALDFVPRTKLMRMRVKRGKEQGRSLDVHILSLRKKIKPLGFKIETLRGVGYRLST